MMQSISANGYPIYFSETGYNALNETLSAQHYSTIFILVDSHSNTHCSPTFLPYLATEIPIEIIEFESGESSKNIET